MKMTLKRDALDKYENIKVKLVKGWRCNRQTNWVTQDQCYGNLMDSKVKKAFRKESVIVKKYYSI